MELRQLRAFVSVAHAEHFGRAAAEIGLTQPALSQRIRQLERELGVRLLERTSRVVRLSSAGRTLLPHARALIEEEDRAIAAMRSLVAGTAGCLRISYYLGGGSLVSARLVAAFRERYPAVAIQESFGYSVTNIERLRAGEVDLVFVRLPMYAIDDLTVVCVEALPYALALPSGHRLTSHRKVDLSELAGERIVIFPREFNPGQYDYMVRGIEEATGQVTRIGAERPSEEAMIAAVSESLGVCLCSVNRSRLMRVVGVRYRELTSCDLTAQLGLAARTQAGTAVRNFIDVAADEIEDQSEAV